MSADIVCCVETVRMLAGISRLLLLAPALTFGLGAAFVLAAFRLGNAPSDPVAWRAFLVLTPIVRQPVQVVAGVPGLGYGFVLVLCASAVLFGCALALSPLRTGRAAFVYAHLALLALVNSMSGAGVFSAGASSGPASSALMHGWSVDLSTFPTEGIVLFLLVAASCACFHFRIFRYLLGRSTDRPTPSQSHMQQRPTDEGG